MSKKIKVTFPYPEWNLSRQTPQSTLRWGNYQFILNDDSIQECDYWFVFDHLLKSTETAICPKEHIILLTGEPSSVTRYNREFIDQFSVVVTCQRELKHRNKLYSIQGHPWFVGAHYANGHYHRFGKGYDELIATTSVSKSKKISIITSDKVFTDGHKRRFDFVMGLKESFGDAMDLYGRGVRNFEDKWDVLADYQYSIAIENIPCPDWITEKLYDCYLSHAFPIYAGAPNASDYFNPQSFTAIDVNDLDSSKKVIDQILNDPTHYHRVLPFVIEAKNSYLNRWQTFPLLAHIADQLFVGEVSKKLNMIHSAPSAHRSVFEKILQKITYAYKDVME